MKSLHHVIESFSDQVYEGRLDRSIHDRSFKNSCARLYLIVMYPLLTFLSSCADWEDGCRVKNCMNRCVCMLSDPTTTKENLIDVLNEVFEEGSEDIADELMKGRNP